MCLRECLTEGVRVKVTGGVVGRASFRVEVRGRVLVKGGEPDLEVEDPLESEVFRDKLGVERNLPVFVELGLAGEKETGMLSSRKMKGAEVVRWEISRGREEVFLRRKEQRLFSFSKVTESFILGRWNMCNCSWGSEEVVDDFSWLY